MPRTCLNNHGRAPVALAVGEWLERVWTYDDHAAVRGHVDPQFEIEAPGGVSIAGPELFINLVNTYKAFVPGLTFRVLGNETHGPVTIVRWAARGRHAGRHVRIEPTGKVITLTGTIVVRGQSSERIRVVGGQWDCASFAAQLGIECVHLARRLSSPPRETVLRSVERRSGVPLLLFPTMSLPGWVTWGKAMNQLERFRPVVTFQLLANRLAFNRHGVPSGYSLRAETRALDAALDRAGHDGPFDVVGHSAGGTLALDYALTHPERVRSLTLIEPGLVWLLRATGGLTKAMEVQLRRRAKQYVARQTKVSYERFFREIYLEKGFDPTASPLLWPLLCAYMHNMPFRMALLRHVDDPARLRAAACPLWIVQGAESDDLHRTGMRVLRDCWPHARLTVLPGGHVPHSGPRLPGFLGHLSRFHRSVAAASRSRPVARAEPRTQPAGHRSETGVVIHG